MEFALGMPPQQALELLNRDGWQVRAFLGYSGWVAGQLEDELKRDTWAVFSPDTAILRGHADEKLWSRLLSGMGAQWALTAREPEYPERN